MAELERQRCLAGQKSDHAKGGKFLKDISSFLIKNF